MPYCPKCKEEIDNLAYRETSLKEQEASLDGQYLDFTETEYYDNEDGKYYCPRCNYLITKDDGEAQDFLQGRPKIDKIFEPKVAIAKYHHEIE